jgi:spore coat protein JB
MIGDDRELRLNMLRRLQEIDFVLVELTLYLDTHPDDLQAVEQFNWYAAERVKAKEAYESRYGPLMQFGHSMTRYPYEWDQGPWPWEL